MLCASAISFQLTSSVAAAVVPVVLQVFGRVWDSSLVKERERLSKLCKLWEGYLEPNVLARIRARMTTNSTDQKAPAAVPVLQQPRPAQQQQSAPPQRMQPQPVLRKKIRIPGQPIRE